MTTANDRTVPVTVLLPVYNGGRHLAAAVSSILTQTHQDLELLAIDDGSTDGSGELLEALDDSRVRVLHQSNVGLVATLNRGLAEARHEVVARMDADDLSSESRLQLQVGFLVSNPDVAAVGCCYDVIDEDDTRIDSVHTAAAPAYLRRQLYFRNVLPHAGMTFRRDAVLAVGGYRDVGPAEDYDLWTRLVQRYPIASLPDSLLQYRSTATGISVLAAEQQRRCLKDIRSRLHSSHPLAIPAARDVLREGLAHSAQFGRTCPTAARSYVFDHAWLAALLARRGQVLPAARLAVGTVGLACRRPASARGLVDVLRRR